MVEMVASLNPCELVDTLKTTIVNFRMGQRGCRPLTEEATPVPAGHPLHPEPHLKQTMHAQLRGAQSTSPLHTLHNTVAQWHSGYGTARLGELHLSGMTCCAAAGLLAEREGWFCQ